MPVINAPDVILKIPNEYKTLPYGIIRLNAVMEIKIITVICGLFFFPESQHKNQNPKNCAALKTGAGLNNSAGMINSPAANSAFAANIE